MDRGAWWVVVHRVPQRRKQLQFSSVAQSCLTLCNSINCSTTGFVSITNSQSLLRLMCIRLVMPSNHLILCHPLIFLPSIIPSIKVFSNKSVLCIKWPKYWSFSFSMSPSNEYSGLISFRMDCLDLLAVLGTLKSLFLHHNSKASILQHSALFMIQLSLTPIHDHWINYSLDYMDLCQRSDVSAF